MFYIYRNIENSTKKVPTKNPQQIFCCTIFLLIVYVKTSSRTLFELLELRWEPTSLLIAEAASSFRRSLFYITEMLRYMNLLKYN